MLQFGSMSLLARVYGNVAGIILISQVRGFLGKVFCFRGWESDKKVFPTLPLLLSRVKNHQKKKDMEALWASKN